MVKMLIANELSGVFLRTLIPNEPVTKSICHDTANQLSSKCPNP